MINERSLATVAASRLPGGRVRPLYDSYGFARLPRAGVEAWWHEPGRFQQDLRGHHGGLEPEEAETWLGALVP